MAKLKPIEVGGVYSVVWRDHFDFKDGSRGAWLSYEEDDKKRDMLCRTFGRVISIEPNFIVLAGTDGDIDSPGEKIYSDVNKLVRNAIVSWERLK